MNLRKIMSIDKKAAKDAQKAVDAIYKKYNKEMNSLIASEIPKGMKLIQGNGMCFIENSEGEEIKSGRAWGLYTDDAQLGRLSALQYSHDVYGAWDLNTITKGTKVTP